MRWGTGIALGVVLALVLLVGAFPWGALEPVVERRLSESYGRPVTIGEIERADIFSFTPTLLIRDVRIPQPDWAGVGDFARVRTARVRFGAFAALVGRPALRSIEIDGLRLALVRDAKGRTNWSSGKDGGGDTLALDRLRLADSRLSYDDAMQDRHADVAIAADAKGLRLEGKGTIRGAPVTIAAHGPAVSSSNAWPFEASITGAALAIAAKGTMAHPLDTQHMVFDVTARARDLKLIDAVIEAGLFGTQPVRLAAHVAHDAPTWTIADLSGTIGRSPLRGHFTVTNGARTKLRGEIAFDRLDFEDLASDEGNAAGLALERSEGLKLVPDTRINLAHIGPTDGTIDIAIKRIVSRRRPSSLSWARGTLTLDHKVLTADPFTLGLSRGTVEGSIKVDQRNGRAVPIVTMALDLKGSTLSAIAGGGGAVDARLSGKLRLVGSGSTIREAVGRSNGNVALVARQGSLPAKLASWLGFDVARGLTTDEDERATLRCGVLALDMKRGTGTLDPMVIDTTRAQSRGVGTISFPSEELAIRITGAPKAKSLLRLPGAILMTGTIRNPHVEAAEGTKSIGNILKAIGQSIVGDQPPRATDADCGALTRRAMDF